MTRPVLPNANVPQVRPPQTAPLLQLPDTVLEEIFTKAPLEVLADARKSCRGLAEVVSRPVVMQAYLEQAWRPQPLPTQKAALSELMQQEVKVLRNIQVRRCEALPVSCEEGGAAVDIAETPANEPVLLARPPGLRALEVLGRGERLWRIPTLVRESAKVPPRLSGDASMVVYLLPSAGQTSEILYLSSQSTPPTPLSVDPSPPISHAKFAPYDDRLVVVHEDAQGDKIRCIDPHQLRDAHAWRMPEGSHTTAIAYAHAPNILASGHRDTRTVQLWDVRQKGPANRQPTSIQGATQIMFSPDAQRVFAGGTGGLALWDLRAGRTQACFEDRTCEAIAIAPNGRWIATKEQEKVPTTHNRQAPVRLRLYDTVPTQEPWTDQRSTAGTVRFSNDGTQLYIQTAYRAMALDFFLPSDT